MKGALFIKPKVYLTRRLADDVVGKIQEVAEVRMWAEQDIPVPRAVLEREIADVDGLYCVLADSIDQELLEQAPKLKVISTLAVGYNNIDVVYASNHNILVCNTPGVLTDTTADLTFALLMMVARRLDEAANFLRQGQWKTWSPMLLTGQDVHGATLGIIGLGRIGQALARRAKGFDMKVLYHSRSRKPEVESELGVEYRALDSLLREADFVCIMTPYTPETRNLIDSKQLSLMKPTSVLINTARGGIVNEQALYQALKDGTIWAAGLDVFEEEPVNLGNPLLTLPNLVTLPHIGSAGIQTRQKMMMIAAQNLIQGLTGDVPTYLVNSDSCLITNLRAEFEQNEILRKKEFYSKFLHRKF